MVPDSVFGGRIINRQRDDFMQDVMGMAGYFAAHAIWSVSDGELLIPIVGFLRADNSRHMERLVMGSVDAVALGHQKIIQLDADTAGGVFINDGMVTLDSGKTDALLVTIRPAADAAKKLDLLIPYRHAKHPDGFAVHRLKLTALEGIEQDLVSGLMQAFVAGLESHEQGARIWRDQYVDQPGVSTGFHGEENTEFTPEEFETLKRSLLLIFFVVAGSDGKVDKREFTTFIKALTDVERFGSALFNRVVTNIIANIPALAAAIVAERPDYLAEFQRVKDIVDAKLPAEEGLEFKVALLKVGHEIASSSGGFLGFGSKISKQEKAALLAIAVCLGVAGN